MAKFANEPRDGWEDFSSSHSAETVMRYLMRYLELTDGAKFDLDAIWNLLYDASLEGGEVLESLKIRLHVAEKLRDAPESVIRLIKDFNPLNPPGA
ncbi:MAG: hypothetical protein J5J00_11185 [Deltaproteobacteria bacterium]|nr:hypothetical protein [Deltaproteobacteria bacterium]